MQPSTLDPIPRLRLARAALARLGRDAGGASAVEFSIVALPFLGIVAAILQVGFQAWAAQNFDRAVQNASRAIFTGDFQTSNAGTTDATELLKRLRTVMCGPANAQYVTLFTCANVKLDVATASTFASAKAATVIDTGTGTWATNFGRNYACAKPGTVVVVTAAVQFPTILGLLGLGLQRFTKGAEAGSGLLMSTAVFRTEPFQITGASPCAS